jgi:hypothetical protein
LRTVYLRTRLRQSAPPLRTPFTGFFERITVDATSEAPVIENRPKSCFLLLPLDPRDFEKTHYRNLSTIKKTPDRALV